MTSQSYHNDRNVNQCQIQVQGASMIGMDSLAVNRVALSAVFRAAGQNPDNTSDVQVTSSYLKNIYVYCSIKE